MWMRREFLIAGGRGNGRNNAAQKSQLRGIEIDDLKSIGFG